MMMNKFNKFYELKFKNKCPDCGGNLEKKKAKKTIRCTECKINYKGYEDYNFLIVLYILVAILLFIFNKGYLNILGLIISFITMEVMIILINFYTFIKYEEYKRKEKVVNNDFSFYYITSHNVYYVILKEVFLTVISIYINNWRKN